MPPEAGARIRVLIADDADDLRMLVRLTLQSDGRFEVVGEAANGSEAVDIAGTQYPDAVVLDLAMPVMDGLQALPEIRKSVPGARIVVLSGFNASQMLSEALALGADAYLEKGEAFKKLIALLLEPNEDTAPLAPSVPAPSAAPGVRSVVAAVAQATDLASAFETFALSALAAVDFDRASFWMATNDDRFECLAAWGPSAWRIPTGTSLAATGRARRVLSGDPVIEADTGGDRGDATNAALFDRGVRSYISIPVVIDGTTKALVNFASDRPNAFTLEDVPPVEALVHDTAGVFHILYLLDRERDAVMKLRDADKMRDDFVGLVAHDLRSPLTVIGGYADHMKGSWAELDDDAKLRSIELIDRNVHDISRMVEDLADVAALESGQLRCDRRAFDLVEVVRETAAEMTVAHLGRSSSCMLPSDLPLAFGDPQRQRQILSNLLCNAVKFSAPPSGVDVELRGEGGNAVVSVRDAGVGIDDEELPRIFEKFYRVENGHRSSGRGLGLYICRRLVEAQGGHIWVHSEPGVGSTFTYTVPLAVAAADAARTDPEAVA